MREQHKIVRWEVPPPAKSRGSSEPSSGYAGIAAELRANPGRWAVVKEQASRYSGLATHIRMGQMICFTPSGDFEATTRRLGERTVVYARYVGDSEATP
jgi:hypothetical protein